MTAPCRRICVMQIPSAKGVTTTLIHRDNALPRLPRRRRRTGERSRFLCYFLSLPKESRLKKTI